MERAHRRCTWEYIATTDISIYLNMCAESDQRLVSHFLETEEEIGFWRELIAEDVREEETDQFLRRIDEEPSACRPAPAECPRRNWHGRASERLAHRIAESKTIAGSHHYIELARADMVDSHQLNRFASQDARAVQRSFVQ